MVLIIVKYNALVDYEIKKLAYTPFFGQSCKNKTSLLIYLLSYQLCLQVILLLGLLYLGNSLCADNDSDYYDEDIMEAVNVS